jgi:hypothetical protein
VLLSANFKGLVKMAGREVKNYSRRLAVWRLELVTDPS